MQSEPLDFDRLYRLGLSPIPLVLGKKRPLEDSWSRYCAEQPTEDTVARWKSDHGLEQIGLCLGSEVEPGHYLVAIDIDAPDMVEPVLAAVGGNGPAKRGAKGMTLFVKSPLAVVNQKIKRRGTDGKAERVPSVEILAAGSQTVIPPSIHPETQLPYQWVNSPLWQGFPHALPEVDEWVIDEIVALCQRKGELFLALNDMTWLGVDKGGNTHDTCVSAVGLMVSRSWPDHAIHRRINRAKAEACARNGDAYNWPQSGRVVQEWINSAKEKGMEGSSKKGAVPKKVPPERVMANWGIEQLGGMENVATVKGQLRRYTDGYWPKVELGDLFRSMYEIDPVLKEKEAKAAISIMHTLAERKGFGTTPELEPKNDPKRQRICLRNGTLNVRTGELERHAREHELSYYLDFDWKEDSTCPTYDRVIAATFDNDEQAMNLWDEYCALTLVDDMTFQKLLFLKGPGGNGKGTLARVLRTMHDQDCVGSIGITDLNDERKRTSLVGKMVNISGEQSRLNLVADTYLKKITGCDPVDVRRLYGETDNNIMLSVRFLELVNEMPQTSDNSHALRRRIMILDCPVKVQNPDPDLDYKLWHERPGILRRWVAALNRLYKRGEFDISAKMSAAIDEYMLQNDPIKTWVLERCREVGEEEKGTLSADLYGDFRLWCEANGYRTPFTSVYWGAKMNGLGYPVKIGKIHGNSIRTRALIIKSGG